MRVEFTDEAIADLRSIALYIARGNKPRAQSFVRELRQKARDLGDYPEAFPILPRYTRLAIRRRTFRDYLIFYRIGPQAVTIIHIIPGARDYEAFLDELM